MNNVSVCYQSPCLRKARVAVCLRKGALCPLEILYFFGQMYLYCFPEQPAICYPDLGLKAKRRRADMLGWSFVLINLWLSRNYTYILISLAFKKYLLSTCCLVMYEAPSVQIWTRQFHWETVSQGSAQENTTLGTLSRRDVMLKSRCLETRGKHWRSSVRSGSRNKPPSTSSQQKGSTKIPWPPSLPPQLSLDAQRDWRKHVECHCAKTSGFWAFPW